MLPTMKPMSLASGESFVKHIEEAMESEQKVVVFLQFLAMPNLGL